MTPNSVAAHVHDGSNATHSGAVQMQAMSHQLGQQPQQLQQVPAQQAQVVGQPAKLVKVAVPAGAVPGQQINFTMDNGQRVTTSVQEHVQPGAMLTVAVPSQPPQLQQAQPLTQPAPAAASQNGLQQVLLPQPVVSAQEADRQATQTGWILFALSFPICCCCSPLVAMIVWGGVALNYFCKPREERRQRPQQFAPACAALSMLGTLCGIMVVCLIMTLMVLAICGADFDTSKPGSCSRMDEIFQNISKHHHHHHPGHPFRPLSVFHSHAEPLFMEDAERPSSLKILTEGTNHDAAAPMPIQEEAVKLEHMQADTEESAKGPWHFGFNLVTGKGHILMT